MTNNSKPNGTAKEHDTAEVVGDTVDPSAHSIAQSAETADASTEKTARKGGKPMSKRRKKVVRATAWLTKTALLAALSTVLYYFVRFPIFPPPFNVLDMDFSDIPALLGGFAMGPVAGVAVVLIKCAIKCASTTTVFVGELANFLSSASFVLTASLIYKFVKSRKGAVLALGVGILVNAIVSSLCNYFITVPLYAKLYAPAMLEYRVAFAFEYGLAFNLIKTTSCSVITFLIYKKLSVILHL